MKVSPLTTAQQEMLNLMLLAAIVALIFSAVICRLSLLALDSHFNTYHALVGTLAAIVSVWLWPLFVLAAIWQIGLQMRGDRQYSISAAVKFLFGGFGIALSGTIFGVTLAAWPFV